MSGGLFALRGAAEGGLLELRAGGGDAVADALALEGALPLLDALQAWLGAPAADVEPAADAPWPAPADALTIGVPGRGRIALPWRALPRSMFGRPLEVAGTALEWPDVSCDLVVAAFAADRLAARQLVPGAMLLLPASFAAPARPLALTAWPQCAAPALGGLAYEVVPDRWHAAPTALADAPEPAPGDDGWLLASATPFAPSAACWFGGGGGPVGWPPLRAIVLRRHGRTLATGRLAPAGGGLGWLIEDVSASDAAAAAASAA